MLGSLTRRVLGLDLGGHSVKLASLRQTWTGLEVEGLFELVPDADEPLAGQLRDFLRSRELEADYAVAAVPGDRLSLRRLRFPFRGRREISQALPFAVEEQLPFDLETVLLDWAPVGGDRSEAEVLAAVAPRAEVARLVETLAEAGAEPRVVEAGGLALANLALVADLSGTRLLLDLGHRKTTLCLLVDGRPVASRTVPLAGRALTDAIARDCGLPREKAERLKCEQGIFEEGLRSELPGAVAVLDRLAREVARTLASLEPLGSDPAAARIEEVVLLGGTARLHRLDDYLAERIGIPARRLGFPPEEPGASLLAAGDPLLFGPAVALALRGTAGARTAMNFRQGELAYRRDLSELGRRLRPTAVLALLAMLLFAGSVGTRVVFENRRAAALEARARALFQEVFPERAPPRSVVAGLRSALRDAHERATFLGVYGGNLSALDVLTEISARVPADLKVVVEELSIDGKVVRITGHTPSFEAVDRLRGELAEFPAFGEIRVSEIQRDARRGGNTFSITIALRDPEASS